MKMKPLQVLGDLAILCQSFQTPEFRLEPEIEAQQKTCYE
jgi:hypothetical protein